MTGAKHDAACMRRKNENGGEWLWLCSCGLTDAEVRDARNDPDVRQGRALVELDAITAEFRE